MKHWAAQNSSLREAIIPARRAGKVVHDSESFQLTYMRAGKTLP
jgi:hypothetical protein